VNEAEMINEQSTLGTLTRTGRAEEDNVAHEATKIIASIKALDDLIKTLSILQSAPKLSDKVWPVEPQRTPV